MRRIIFITMIMVLIGCSRAMAYTNPDNYRVQPEDVLQITVYEHEDLTTKARVGAAGNISFPLLEKVQVAGLTVQEIEHLLKARLEKDYLVSAHVQVFIENYHVKQVTILGAVDKPGKYDLKPEQETRILEAVAMAGGFTDYADINGTRIIRTKEDRTKTILVPVKDITSKGMTYKDVILEGGDIIYVPESIF